MADDDPRRLPMSDERLREAYGHGLSAGNRRQPFDDLEGERLRRLVEREGSEDQRLHTLDALLATRGGQQDLEIAWAAARAATPPRRAPWMRTAAAVLFAIGLSSTTWWMTRENVPDMRGAASPITLVTPLGDVEANAGRHLVWRPLPDAERYTAVLVDSAGNEVFAGETRDTSLTLPEQVRLEPGGTYLWWVQARTRYGESVTAVTERVRVLL